MTVTVGVGSLAQATTPWTAMQLLDSTSGGWRSGLLADLVKHVLEAALEAEMEAHLGYSKNSSAGRRRGSNSRNGTRRKTVRTCTGPVTIEVPRDRWGTFEPRTVGKWQRRGIGLDQLVLPLSARGATTGETIQLLTWVYGDTLEERVLRRLAMLVEGRLGAWHERPLAPGWPVVFLERVVVRSRSTALATPPVHTAVGVDADGRRELLAVLRGGPVRDGFHWHGVLTELRSRGVVDVDVVVADPVPGMGRVVGEVWRGASLYERPSQQRGGLGGDLP